MIDLYASSFFNKGRKRIKMKRIYTVLATISFCLVIITGCRKSQPDNQLPPATQTGKNTFGALINSSIWVPKGSVFATPNLQIRYNPDYANGSLAIFAYRIPDTVINHRTHHGVLIDSIKNYSYPHTFVLRANSQNDFGYTGYPCNYDTNDPLISGKGSITITKFDYPNAIVSGTFSVSFSKNGCPDVTITDGRFDMKLN
jgi:hypothetical protein